MKIINGSLSILALSFSLTGLLMYFLTTNIKVSNYMGFKCTLTHPNAFLFIFLGSVTYLLSDIYSLNWNILFFQTSVSIIYFYIYKVHKTQYNEELKYENR